jgi:hypothetical protein
MDHPQIQSAAADRVLMLRSVQGMEYRLKIASEAAPCVAWAGVGNERTATTRLLGHQIWTK